MPHARQLVDRCIHGDLMDTLISRQTFGLLWLNPPYGDLEQGRQNGNIGYQGQGRARLEQLFYQRALPLLQYRRRADLHHRAGPLRARRRAGRMADAPLRRSAHLPCGETQFKQVVVLVAGFASATRLRIRPRPRVVCCCKIGQGETQAEELPLEWPFLPYRPHEPRRAGALLSRDDGTRGSSPTRSVGWGLWPALDTHLAAAQQSLRPPAPGPVPLAFALALAAGAISGVVRSRDWARACRQR